MENRQGQFQLKTSENRLSQNQRNFLLMPKTNYPKGALKQSFIRKKTSALDFLIRHELCMNHNYNKPGNLGQNLRMMLDATT